MVRFSLNIQTSCSYVAWEMQDHIWANMFCIPKNIHCRTPTKWCDHHGSDIGLCN